MHWLGFDILQTNVLWPLLVLLPWQWKGQTKLWWRGCVLLRLFSKCLNEFFLMSLRKSLLWSIFIRAGNASRNAQQPRSWYCKRTVPRLVVLLLSGVCSRWESRRGQQQVLLGHRVLKSYECYRIDQQRNRLRECSRQCQRWLFHWLPILIRSTAKPDLDVIHRKFKFWWSRSCIQSIYKTANFPNNKTEGGRTGCTWNQDRLRRSGGRVHQA